MNNFHIAEKETTVIKSKGRELTELLLPDYYKIIADHNENAPIKDNEGNEINYIKHKSLNALTGLS